MSKGSGGALQPVVAMHIINMYPNTGGGRQVEQEIKVRRLQGKQFLFTCQGEWGVLPPEAFKIGSEPIALSDAVDRLRNSEAGLAMWLKVRQEAIRFTTWLTVKDWSICLELCPKSLAKKHEIRLHAHLAIMFERKRDFKMDARQFRFLNGGIHLSENELSLRRKVGWGCFYYVSAPKTSQLFAMSTKDAFLDYPVQMQWIWNLLQAGKMSPETGRIELIKGAHRLPCHLPALDRLSSEVMNLRLQRRIEEKEQDLRNIESPSRRLRRWIG